MGKNEHGRKTHRIFGFSSRTPGGYFGLLSLGYDGLRVSVAHVTLSNCVPDHRDDVRPGFTVARLFEALLIVEGTVVFDRLKSLRRVALSRGGSRRGGSGGGSRRGGSGGGSRGSLVTCGADDCSNLSF